MTYIRQPTTDIPYNHISINGKRTNNFLSKGKLCYELQDNVKLSNECMRWESEVVLDHTQAKRK